MTNPATTLGQKPGYEFAHPIIHSIYNLWNTLRVGSCRPNFYGTGQKQDNQKEFHIWPFIDSVTETRPMTLQSTLASKDVWIKEGQRADMKRQENERDGNA